MALTASHHHQSRRAIPLPLADTSPAALAFVTLTHDKSLHISKARGERDGAPGINNRKAASRLPAAGTERALPVLGAAVPRVGAAAPTLGTQPPTWPGTRPLLQEPRQGPGLVPGRGARAPAPPTPPQSSSHSPRPSHIPHPQASGRIGSSQLPLLNAVSPQLQVMMIITMMMMPIAIPSSPQGSPSRALFFTKPAPKNHHLAMPGTETADAEALFKELY